MGKSSEKTPVTTLFSPLKLNPRSASRRIKVANFVCSDLSATVAKLKAEKSELVAKNNAKDHMIQHFLESAVAASSADSPLEAVTRDMFLRMMANNQLVPEGGNTIDPEIDMAVGDFFKVGAFDIHDFLLEYQTWAVAPVPPAGVPPMGGGPAGAAAAIVAGDGELVDNDENNNEGKK